MNVRLDKVLSDITGVTGLLILDAILAGQRDPVKLAQLRDERCQNSQEIIAQALRGNWRDEHLFALRQALTLYRIYHQQIAECDRHIEAHLATFADRWKTVASGTAPRQASHDTDLRHTPSRVPDDGDGLDPPGWLGRSLGPEADRRNRH
jgi:hypothetical protein